MPSLGVCLQLTGVCLSALGWLGAVACCALPFWKHTTFLGLGGIKQKMVDGLWFTCSLPGPGKANCKVFSSSHKDLGLDFYVGRILTLATITMAFLGLLINCLGARCISCVPDKGVKAKLLTASGLIFILAGLAQLLAVSWPAYILATEFYHPLVAEMLVISIGPCIYLGLAAGTLLLLGGCILGCWCCRRRMSGAEGGRYPPGRGPDQACKDFV
uniref:claudin-4-like n=1 Tax=Pristiophorus japonicus TaxID=55135 RepID=UPI00398F30D6